MEKLKNIKKYVLQIIIEILDECDFKQKEIKELIIKEDSFLFLKKEPNSLNISLRIDKWQGNKKENENLIFSIEFEEDNVSLINLYDKGVFKTKEKFYNFTLNDNIFNYKLYKTIRKISTEKNFDKNKIYNYIHELQINDIIFINDIKLILREFDLNKENINNNNINPAFIVQLKEGKNKKCLICKEGELGQDNPLLNFCCNEFTHYLCKKKEIKDKIKKEEIYKDCFRYFIKTYCNKCEKVFPLNFIYNKKYYELINIQRNISEDYILFETLDFKCNDGDYGKYFFYIKLNKEKEKILIGGKNINEKYINEFDKLIKLEDKINCDLISSEQGLIEYDKKNKKLILKNIDENKNIFVLQDTFLLKPDNDITNINYGKNIQIKTKLINNNEIDKNEINNDKNEIKNE